MQIFSLEITPFISLFLVISVIGIAASGNAGKAFGRFCAVAISWWMSVIYGPGLAMALNDTSIILKCIDAIPFLENVYEFSNSGSILFLLENDFSNFLVQMLQLFVFTFIIDLLFELFSSFIEWTKNISFFLIGTLLPWFVRFLISVFGMWIYLAIYSYIISDINKNLLMGFALVVFISMLVMLLAPLIKFLLLAAQLIPHPVIKNIAEFVQKNTLGSTLNSAFYGSFLLLIFLTILQAINLPLISQIGDELEYYISLLNTLL